MIPSLYTASLCWTKVITDLSFLQPQVETDILSQKKKKDDEWDFQYFFKTEKIGHKTLE